MQHCLVFGSTCNNGSGENLPLEIDFPPAASHWPFPERFHHFPFYTRCQATCPKPSGRGATCKCSGHCSLQTVSSTPVGGVHSATLTWGLPHWSSSPWVAASLCLLCKLFSSGLRSPRLPCGRWLNAYLEQMQTGLPAVGRTGRLESLNSLRLSKA